MKNIRYSFFFLMALVALLFAACKKDRFNADFDLPRQFKPGDISIAAGETQARLSWSPSLFSAGKGVTYTVQVAEDTTSWNNLVYNKVVDTSMAIITENELTVGRAYFARVKANANGPTAESGWVISESFRITGEQILAPVLDADITDSSVLLKWRPTTGLTKITVTPDGGGAAIEVPLTEADVAANEKRVRGLTQLTAYTARIFRNNTQKGVIRFTTKEKSIFAVIISPSDDLVETVNNAANGDIIGLRPGTYNTVNSTGGFTNLEVVGKTITLQSFSGSPANTIVNFKELKVKGTGAGIILRGITFDGTPGSADYFLNLGGLNSDADAAIFTKLVVENSIVRGTNNSLLRGNRGSSNAHKIDSIQLKNSIFADNGSSAGFDYILLDKMEFNALDISQSTFYNSGRRLISWATNITAPKPTITLNYVTINGLGYGGRDNVLLDANANTVDFTMKNSILANTPKTGQMVGNNLLRASNAAASVVIANSNLFNLSNGAATPAELSVPSYVSLQNNQSVDLGWTAATTTFALPNPSPLRSASESNGPIGDPRWW